MRGTPAVFRELNVVEQRYQAVVEILDGTPVIWGRAWGDAAIAAGDRAGTRVREHGRLASAPGRIQ